MSAGTQGFTDTRKDTNHIGAVISKVLEARKLAEQEREYAESVAEKYQTSLEESGIQRGYFFKKALRWKFGGEFKAKKQAQLQTWKSRADLFKSAATGKSGRNKLNKFERSQAIFDMFKSGDKPKTFRDKFKPLYEGFVDDPMARPQSHWVKPGARKKIQKATSRSNRVSKEDILNSLSAITDSIERVAESISEKNKVIADQMVHSSVLQGMMHQQLKTSNDSLEDKLQKIVDVLSNQTQYQKQSVDKIEAKSAENKLERQKDAASIVNFDDLTTKEDESKIAATSAQDMEFQQMSAYEQNDIPQAETGGIISGPDSGYLAKLHGNEMVIPLDNNYTQGEPSAIDGKVRPKPQQPIATPKSIESMPKYEMGTSKIVNNYPKYEMGNSTVNSAPITSKFGFDTTKNITGIAGGGTTESSKLTQSMVDVMSLPMMAAGGTLLSATTKYMQSLGGEGANINPEIERVSRPIANVFGLPPTIVSAAKGSTSRRAVGEEEQKEDGESKKDLFAKLTDGFGKLLEKLGNSINNRPTDTTTDDDTTGNGPGGSGQDFATLATIAALESGSAQGQADVAQSVYNRLGDTGQMYGKSITEILTRDNQYQVAFKDPNASSGEGAKVADVFKNIKNEDDAAKAIMYYYSKRGRPVTEEQARQMYRSSAKAISDAKLRENAARHVGGRTEFLGRGLGGAGSVSRGGGSDNDFFAAYGSRTQMARGAQAAPSGLFNAPSPSQSAPQTPAQLGQAITSNYGLKVGQERQFTHPEYGTIKAHKTATGFDFYDGPTKLDMSKPQGKAIVEYFKSTNGGQKISPPPAGQQISSLSTSSSKSSGGGITVLNTGGGQQIASAGSSPQPSADGGVESGRNPTQDFFSNSFSLGVG
jgi:hypothetical protein